MARLMLSLDGQILAEYNMNKERYTIGRLPDNDIRIDNPAVSGHHSLIINILNDSFLEDLNSTNGTYVNGKLIKKHAMQHGDVITVGHHQLRFVDSQDGEAESSDEGEGEGEDQSPQSATLDDSEKSHRESETAESTLTETEEDENAEPSDEELETGDGDRPARPDLKDSGKAEPAYKIYTTAHDEVVTAEELCDAEELTRLRTQKDADEERWLILEMQREALEQSE